MKITVLAVALVAFGCNNSPSRLDATAATPPPEAVAAAPGSGTEADRIARLERRLDKVIKALDQAMGPAEPDPAAMYAVPINELDPIEGPRDAKVTIVEVSEFLCPFCYMVNPTVEQIRAKYPKDVRVVSKYMVIHGQPAVTAGTYACAANKQGKFSEMKTALWNNLWKTENGRPQSRPEEIAKLDDVAAGLGLDRGRLTADLDTCKQWIESGSREVNPIGIHGTPAFFVNGRPVREKSLAAFDKLITQELEKASNSKVAAADYYNQEIVGKGLRSVKGRFAD